MNTFEKIIAGICIVAIPFFNACKDNDPDPCNYATEVQDEYEAFQAALTAFSNDPTNVEKCNAYKNSLQDYVNALQDHDGCVPVGQEDEYQMSLDQAQAAINQIQC